MRLKKLWQHIVCAARNWVADDATTMGAALAFYCAFSLAPLLVLLVTLAGWVVGVDAAYSYVGQQLVSLFGKSTADVLIEAARSAQSEEGIVAAILSGVTLVIGATTVFAALKSALELIWGSQALAPTGWRGFVRSRLLSFGFILALGFILLVSLTLSTALAALRGAFLNRYTALVFLTGAIDFLLSMTFSSALFAVAYRYLPTRRVAWRLAIVGAIATALLFQFGRWAIGLYLGRSTQPSAFGAAASFVALLLWLYYSAQIFLFGAEFTSCYAGLRADKPDAQRAPAARERTPRAAR